MRRQKIRRPPIFYFIFPGEDATDTRVLSKNTFVQLAIAILISITVHTDRYRDQYIHGVAVECHACYLPVDIVTRMCTHVLVLEYGASIRHTHTAHTHV